MGSPARQKRLGLSIFARSFWPLKWKVDVFMAKNNGQKGFWVANGKFDGQKKMATLGFKWVIRYLLEGMWPKVAKNFWPHGQF